MSKLSIFQRNCLAIGTYLAAEILSSSFDLRAFVVIGAYSQTPRGPARPTKILNKNQDDLRFWIRKYEVKKDVMENGWDVTDRDLLSSIYLKNIQTIEELEVELGKYIQDFSLMEVGWKVEHPFP